MFVKTGDTVKVIAGKDRGTTGKVIKALPKVNKVVVEGNVRNEYKLVLRILQGVGF